MLVEICANSYQSAINAEKAGAHRIELCSELAVGGITPSYGLIKKVVEEISIPTYVLIRPRSGDFTYSNDEFEVMKQDIEFCKQIGCAGVVSGILNSDNTIDIERTKKLVTIAKPLLSFTFHRAFDWVENPNVALHDLLKLGVHRVLTSGQENSAQQGISNLIFWQNMHPLLKILPGGGINIKNAHLFKEAGFSEIHLSATSQVQTIKAPKVSMNSTKFFDETKISFSDIETIQSILKIVKDEE
jgi:copper homeostasis protein